MPLLNSGDARYNIIINILSYLHSPKQIQINAFTIGLQGKPIMNRNTEYELKPPMHREVSIQVETGSKTGRWKPS